VSAVVIVEVQIGVEECLTLGEGLEGEVIGPFSKKRLDEPLGFSVGAWRVGRVRV
jgi:hypothetical protein